MISSILLNLRTVEKLNPSSAFARDFLNAVQQRPEQKYYKNVVKVILNKHSVQYYIKADYL